MVLGWRDGSGAEKCLVQTSELRRFLKDSNRPPCRLRQCSLQWGVPGTQLNGEAEGVQECGCELSEIKRFGDHHVSRISECFNYYQRLLYSFNHQKRLFLNTSGRKSSPLAINRRQP